MTPIQTGLLGCVLLVALLLSSMPVAFALAIAGGVGFFMITGSSTAAVAMMVNELHGIFSSQSLTVIPLFVLMGQLAFHSGISGRLFEAAYRWLGALPGGLAMATVGACTGFGAICGSGPATAATMAAVAMPEMRKRHYDLALASGTVAAGGSLGMLIPPSVVFIVYGVMTEQSPEKLFVAGILPGLLIALLFCLTIYIICRRHPERGPAGEACSLLTKVRSLRGVSETAILFTLVIGGMFFGWFTSTEAAAIGAAGTMAVAAVKRQLTWHRLARSLLETLRTSCMIMIIVAGALMFGRFLAVSGIPAEMARWFTGLPLPAWAVLGIMILFYLVAGCFLDALALVLLTIPIFFPVIVALNADPIWFGVIIVVITQMGVISPPVGVNVYVVSGMERDIPMQDVFRGALPFLWTLVLSAGLLLAFPGIALFLPQYGPKALLFLALGASVLAVQAAAVALAARSVNCRGHSARAVVASVLAALVCWALTPLLLFWLRAGGQGALAGPIVWGGVICAAATLIMRFALRLSWLKTAAPAAGWALVTAVGWPLLLTVWARHFAGH
jgi:tripartite ATP-independent transporter DctM subunit